MVLKVDEMLLKNKIKKKEDSQLEMKLQSLIFLRKLTYEQPKK